jgi:hypothetical protein
MNVSALSPLAFIALLAAVPAQFPRDAAPAPNGSSGITRSRGTLPSQEQLLLARVATLEREVTALQSEMDGLKNHVHSFLAQRNPTTYMSMHDFATNIKPGSPIPTTEYYVPLILSPAGQPSISGLRATTSTPIAPPP